MARRQWLVLIAVGAICLSACSTVLEVPSKSHSADARSSADPKTTATTQSAVSSTTSVASSSRGVSVSASAATGTRVCSEIEKLCFVVPADWTVEPTQWGQGAFAERIETSKPEVGNASITAKVSGIGGSCVPSAPLTLRKVSPLAVKNKQGTPLVVLAWVSPLGDKFETRLGVFPQRPEFVVGGESDNCYLSMPGVFERPSGTLMFNVSFTEPRRFATVADAEQYMQSPVFLQLWSVLTSLQSL